MPRTEKHTSPREKARGIRNHSATEEKGRQQKLPPRRAARNKNP